MSNEPVDILLVEDDRRLADLTAEYFRQNGMSVAIESRGDRAVARFKTEQPRIVLLDLMLPGADGLTVCRELREFFNGPILIFTARDSDIDQVIGLEAGADDYVAKPVDPMVLLARIRALLRRIEELDLRGAVTLASLIERETSVPEERGRISRVFHNRLQRHMLLQCDPTVSYALQREGRPVEKLYSRHLDFDSPWNTYRYPGLPPGPIASPGAESLRAAVDPASGDASER